MQKWYILLVIKAMKCSMFILKYYSCDFKLLIKISSIYSGCKQWLWGDNISYAEEIFLQQSD
jgi:hypothetical protein